MPDESFPTTPVAYDATARPTPALDPLRYCVMTTVALLAWLASPPVVVTVMGGLGFTMYWQAMRGGLTRSRCVLRHPKLVLAYLGAAACLGAATLVMRIAG